jgi:hypothetical protein
MTSKSHRIRKYKIAYEKCLKLIEEIDYCSFDNFLLRERNKPEYRNMSVRETVKVIKKLWEQKYKL